MSSVSPQSVKDGLDSNQVRLAVERAFRNCGVKIVEPNTQALLASRLMINLDVRYDPNTQLYISNVELKMFEKTDNSRKADETNFKIGTGPICGIKPTDMPESVCNQVGGSLLALVVFYLPDKDKGKLIECLMEGYSKNMAYISPESLIKYRNKALEKEEDRVDGYDGKNGVRRER